MQVGFVGVVCCPFCNNLSFSCENHVQQLAAAAQVGDARAIDAAQDFSHENAAEGLERREGLKSLNLNVGVSRVHVWGRAV